MATLEYNGRMPVDTVYKNSSGETKEELSDSDNPSNWSKAIPDKGKQKLHQLLDDVINDYESGNNLIKNASVYMDQADQVEGSSLPRIHVNISSEGELSELTDVQKQVSESAVSIGMEEDVETAKERINLN
jgi:hypothetical protein